MPKRTADILVPVFGRLISEYYSVRCGQSGNLPEEDFWPANLRIARHPGAIRTERMRGGGDKTGDDRFRLPIVRLAEKKNATA